MEVKNNGFHQQKQQDHSKRLSFKHHTEVQLLFRYVHTDKIKIFHTFVFNVFVKKRIELNLTTLTMGVNLLSGPRFKQAGSPLMKMELISP